jgi:hypothetical protein
MLKERLAIANRLAKEMHEAEAAIDMAIAKVGTLMASLPQAQADVKLSAVVGDRAFGHLQSAAVGMLGVRTSIVALHNELASIKDKVGLRNMIVGIGDAGKLLPSSGSLVEADAPAALQAKAA